MVIEKDKDMNENPDFEKDQYSRTAESIYKIGHGSIRLKTWLVHYDRSSYEIVIFYDQLGSFLNRLKEISL